jgi:transcriptional regulator GlxA family with amidase domain
MARQLRQIAFTLYPGVSPLDLVGPLTVLRDLKVGSPYRTVVVGADRGSMPTDTSMRMIPAATFADIPEPFAVFVPGGGHATLDAMADESLLAYVRTAAGHATVIGATGNGALILGAAGLLRGRRVATHWAYADLLEAVGATYVPDPWVEDGPYLTAAGGTAGIDAMLHWTARLKSASRARLAQLAMEYDPQPPFTIDRQRGDPGLAAWLRGASAGAAGAGGPRGPPTPPARRPSPSSCIPT